MLDIGLKMMDGSGHWSENDSWMLSASKDVDGMHAERNTVSHSGQNTLSCFSKMTRRFWVAFHFSVCISSSVPPMWPSFLQSCPVLSCGPLSQTLRDPLYHQ